MFQLEKFTTWEKKSERLPFRSNRFRGFRVYNRLATKWSQILSLGCIDKIRNHLVANPIDISSVK